MKRSFSAILLLVVIAWFSQACQLSVLVDSESAAPGSVLFQDDFSDPASGWLQGEDEIGKTEYAGDGLRILVNSDVAAKISIPQLQFTDVQIEVDALKVAGPDDNDFGIICRFVDENNFYFFEISSDGYYGIGKFKDNELMLIGMSQMQSSDAIHQGMASNHLRADCVGNRLTFYANGKKLGEVEDDDFQKGDVGLMAGTFETPGADILFDNFTVLKP